MSSSRQRTTTCRCSWTLRAWRMSMNAIASYLAPLPSPLLPSSFLPICFSAPLPRLLCVVPSFPSLPRPPSRPAGQQLTCGQASPHAGRQHGGAGGQARELVGSYGPCAARVAREAADVGEQQAARQLCDREQ
eukprot:746476-Hanusia_phi.AAC.1